MQRKGTPVLCRALLPEWSGAEPSVFSVTSTSLSEIDCQHAGSDGIEVRALAGHQRGRYACSNRKAGSGHREAEWEATGAADSAADSAAQL